MNVFLFLFDGFVDHGPTGPEVVCAGQEDEAQEREEHVVVRVARLVILEVGFAHFGGLLSSKDYCCLSDVGWDGIHDKKACILRGRSNLKCSKKGDEAVCLYS